LIIVGAKLQPSRRAGFCPSPLKSWCQELSGMVKRLPSCHSNVCFSDLGVQMSVAPRPLT
jgi:hypothetical protein